MTYGNGMPGAFALDLTLLLAGGQEMDGDTLLIRPYTALPDGVNSTDETIAALQGGCYPRTGFATTTVRTPTGQQRTVYLYEDDVRSDAAMIADELAWRIAEDSRNPQITTLLTISDDIADHVLRLSIVDAFRIRVWQIDGEAGPRLLPPTR